MSLHLLQTSPVLGHKLVCIAPDSNCTHVALLKHLSDNGIKLVGAIPPSSSGERGLICVPTGDTWKVYNLVSVDDWECEGGPPIRPDYLYSLQFLPETDM